MENTAQARVWKRLDKISKLRALSQGLNQTVSGAREGVVEVLDAELIRVQLFITAARVKSKGTLREAVCGVLDVFPIEASSDVQGRAAGVISDQA